MPPFTTTAAEGRTGAKLGPLIKYYLKIAVQILQPLLPCSLTRWAQVLLIISILWLCSYSQDVELLTTKPVMNDVSSRFRLGSSDIRSIRGIVEKENLDVLSIYARFGGGKQAEYDCELWRDVEERRRAFDARVSHKLNSKQRAALRAARLELERRVLDSLVDEYFLVLDDLLELNAVQREALMHMLYVDSRKRHWTIVQYVSDPNQLRLRMHDCDQDMDRWMNLILTPTQRRLYEVMSFSKDIVG